MSPEKTNATAHWSFTTNKCGNGNNWATWFFFDNCNNLVGFIDLDCSGTLSYVKYDINPPCGDQGLTNLNVGNGVLTYLPVADSLRWDYYGYANHYYDLYGYKNNVLKYRVYDSMGGIYYQIYSAPVVNFNPNKELANHCIENDINTYSLDTASRDSYTNTLVPYFHGKPEITIYGKTGNVDLNDIRNNQFVDTNKSMLNGLDLRGKPKITISGKSGSFNFDALNSNKLDKGTELSAPSRLDDLNQTTQSTNVNSQINSVSVSSIKGVVTVELTTKSNLLIRISLCDYVGKVLSTYTSEVSPNIQNIVNIHESQSLPSGVYFVRVEAGPEIIIRKISIVH